MKKSLLPALFVIGIGLLFSCTKPNNSPTNNSPTASMSASVAGKSWTAKTVTAVANSVTITLRGTASDGSYMQFSLPPSVTAGTYTLSQSGDYTYQYNTTVTTYLVTTGTLVITKYTPGSIITGTFTASANNNSGTISVTSGSFTGLFQ